MKQHIIPAYGKLGILIPGLGAVATTVIAGVEAVKKGIAKPIESLTQLVNIRLGKRTENKFTGINKLVPFSNLNEIALGDYYQELVETL